jgi:multiple sugar transport system permease protein
MTSFKTDADISASPTPLFFRPVLDHYAKLFNSSTFKFPMFLSNSLIIATLSSIITILLTLPAAFAITSFNIGKKLIFPLTTSFRTIPLIVFAVPIYLLLNNWGIIDTKPAIILVHILVNLPLSIILLTGFMVAVPKEMQEAAKIDGANSLTILVKIVTPLMINSVVAVFILNFIYSWNEFLFALILSIKNSTTLTVGASLFITAWGVEWGNIAAAITLSVLPPFFLTFYIQRYLVEAFSGGVKG